MAASQDRRLARIAVARQAEERERRRLAQEQERADLAAEAEAFRARQAKRQTAEATS